MHALTLSTVSFFRPSSQLFFSPKPFWISFCHKCACRQTWCKEERQQEDEEEEEEEATHDIWRRKSLDTQEKERKWTQGGSEWAPED
jgi:hypothetical protein